jgi:hypothetical protein
MFVIPEIKVSETEALRNASKELGVEVNAEETCTSVSCAIIGM